MVQKLMFTYATAPQLTYYYIVVLLNSSSISRHQTDVLAISSDDFHHQRRPSFTSDEKKQAWGTLPRNKVFRNFKFLKFRDYTMYCDLDIII